MQPYHFSVPLLRAAVWSVEPLLPSGDDGFLDIATGPPDVGFLEPLLRRRLSPLGRGMLHCAGRVADGFGPLPSVFASRHGDVARTMPILEDLARGVSPSPTQFSMNVQNAVAGIWSIARQDPSPSISLAAGAETFGLGLLEAHSIQARTPGQPVLFVYAEEPLPALFAPFADRELPLHAVALLVGLPAARQLVVSRKPDRSGDEAPVPQSMQALQALLAGHCQGPWTEASGTWSWRVD